MKKITEVKLLTKDSISNLVLEIAKNVALKTALPADTQKLFTDPNFKIDRGPLNTPEYPSQSIIQSITDAIQRLYWYDRMDILDEEHPIHQSFIDHISEIAIDKVRKHRQGDPQFLVTPVDLLSLNIMKGLRKKLDKDTKEEYEEGESTITYSLDEEMVNNFLKLPGEWKEKNILITELRYESLEDDKVKQLAVLGYSPAPYHYVAGLLLQYPSVQKVYGYISTVADYSTLEPVRVLCKGRKRKVTRNEVVWSDFEEESMKSIWFFISLNAKGRLVFDFSPRRRDHKILYAFVRENFVK